MNTTMRIPRVLVVVAAAALVAACGGGGGDVDAPPKRPAASDAVPAQASRNAEGLIGWLRALAQENDAAEAKAPLDLSAFVPPVADDREPLPVR